MSRSLIRIILIVLIGFGFWAIKTNRNHRFVKASSLGNDLSSESGSTTAATSFEKNDIKASLGVLPAKPVSAQASTSETCSSSCADTTVAKQEIPTEMPGVDLRQVRNSLPTLKSVQDAVSRGESIHTSPKFITSAGRDIGRVMTAGDGDVKLRKPAIEMFTNCAEDREIVRSVRAHCYAAAIRSSRKWAMFIPFSELRVDDEIKVMAARFPIQDSTAAAVSQ